MRGTDGAATLVCGVGPVEAAAVTAAALATDRPDALLHIGIAGCRRGCGLEPPMLVVGSEAIYCDTDSVLIEARVDPDPQLLTAARRALPDAVVRPIGTSARVGGTTGCDIEAMEGFGVLRAAAAAGIPAIEVRAVANEVEEPDRALWRFDDALAALAEAVPRLVRALG